MAGTSGSQKCASQSQLGSTRDRLSCPSLVAQPSQWQVADRDDARLLTPELRRYHWHQAALRGQELAEEFELRFQAGTLLDGLQTLG
jgi:hypothetical protein